MLDPSAAVDPDLKPTITSGGQVTPLEEGGWRLEIPPGPGGSYRLAQLDDYTGLARRAFPWKPPLTLSLRARASDEEIPGTWGFGLWNDPFSVSLGFEGATRALPVLPNAAWFFFASPPNYLSLRDDLPARGSLAAVFRSAQLPAALLALGLPALPLFFFPPAMRLLRRLGRRFVHQDALALAVDPTLWHTYGLEWLPDSVVFRVNAEKIFASKIAPSGPLGLVIWVDNQYAALLPDGRLAFGSLPSTDTAWIEVDEVAVRPGMSVA